MLCTPRINGKLNGAVYYAASILGIKESYSLGGASAIMALANGTSKVKSVNKIVGPGSKWIALAKKMVFLEGLCGIESANMGPSEYYAGQMQALLLILSPLVCLLKMNMIKVVCLYY